LGNGKVSKRTTKVPKVIPGLTNIKMVAAGHVHSLALDFQGRVYSFGSNSFGQLGLGKNRDKVFTPTLIPDLIDITAIFAYGFSSMALNRHGEVYEFGFFYADFGYSETGDIIADNHPTPHLLELKKIVTISLGLANGLFLDSEGQVYGCGENNNYSLGLASNQVRYPLTLINHLEKIVSISATRNYSLFLNDQGMVFMLGDLRGETRYSGDLKTIYPILLPGFHNIISTMFLTTLDVIGLDNQGKIWKLDYGNIPDLDDPVEITPLGQKVVGISYNNQGDILIQDNGRVESYSDINETPSSLITLEIY
jgi:alpha-tubulin suppressor-like RCC1 family protein